MTPNNPRNLTNRSNALKLTGPTSMAVKRASSQNSRKHGLNSAPDFESSLEYKVLVELIAEEGFSAFTCADIAAGHFYYRRVMDAYYDTYTSRDPVDEFLRDANVKASDLSLSLASFSVRRAVSPKMYQRLQLFFADMQRQELRKGGPVSRRSSDTHKLIRYQRNGIARLSRAIRQA